MLVPDAISVEVGEVIPALVVFIPGANTSIDAPKFEKGALASSRVVAPTAVEVGG
jgi:hypothetical protein